MLRNKMQTDSSVHLQVRASRIGYYTLSESITIPADGDRNTIIKQTMALSPRLSLQGNNDKYRIVLTWGKTPKDLDSYLLTPWSAGAQCKKGMVSRALFFIGTFVFWLKLSSDFVLKLPGFLISSY